MFICKHKFKSLSHKTTACLDVSEYDMLYGSLFANLYDISMIEDVLIVCAINFFQRSTDKKKGLKQHEAE